MADLVAPTEQPHDTFMKNVALSATISEKTKSTLTLKQNKALHVLSKAVRDQFFVLNPHFNPTNISQLTLDDLEQASFRRIFKIEENAVMQAMGHCDKRKFYSKTEILKIFKELANQAIYIDALGFSKEGAESEDILGWVNLLGSAHRNKGCFVFDVPALAVMLMVNPDVWFWAPVSLDAYKTKHAPWIYETCLIAHQNQQSQTEDIAITDLRNIAGSDKTTYRSFDNIRTRILDTTLASLNAQRSLDLHIAYEAFRHPEEKKVVGRPAMTHIRFTFHQKTDNQIQDTKIDAAFDLRVYRDEILSFGVPERSLNSILELCHDHTGKVSLPFLRYTVQKANQLRAWNRAKPKRNESDNSYKIDNFGGWYRTKIIIDRKEEFFAVFDLLTAKLIERHGSQMVPEHPNFLLYFDQLDFELKKIIAINYISRLSAFAFAYLHDAFKSHLEKEKPEIFQRYINDTYGQSLTNLAEIGDSHFLEFLDFDKKLFDKPGYQMALREF